MGLIERLRERILTSSTTDWPQMTFGLEMDRYAREKDAFVRNPEAEATIMKKWPLAGLYAKHIIEGRWSEFEEAMGKYPAVTELNDVRAVFHYVRDMVREPLQSVEHHVVSDGQTAADYAIHVRHAPWIDTDHRNQVNLDAHNAILNDETAYMVYHHQFHPESYGLK